MHKVHWLVCFHTAYCRVCYLQLLYVFHQSNMCFCTICMLNAFPARNGISTDGSFLMPLLQVGQQFTNMWEGMKHSRPVVLYLLSSVTHLKTDVHMCYTLVGCGHNWPVCILWVTKSWTNWTEDCLQHVICQNLEKKQACVFSCPAYTPFHGHISILVAVVCISLQKLCSALILHDAHVHKLKTSLSPSICEFEVM